MATTSKPTAPITFVVSDETRTCYNCRVLSAGMDTADFMANPVMLYMHQRGTVIGRWENLRLEAGQWLADAVFDSDDDTAAVIAGKVERGFLKAASVCVQIVDLVYNEALDLFDLTRSVLDEISIVDMGGNRNALRLVGADGSELDQDSLLRLTAPLKPTIPKPTIPLANPPSGGTSAPDAPMKTFMQLVALSLGLMESATEDEIKAKAAALKSDDGYKAKYETLKGEISLAQTKTANSLIDAAIAEKRIPATAREKWTARFTKDHDDATELLAELKAPVDLVQFANNGAKGQVAANATEAEQFDAHDKAGTLGKLKTEDHATFMRLFKAKTGKEYSA